MRNKVAFGVAMLAIVFLRTAPVTAHHEPFPDNAHTLTGGLEIWDDMLADNNEHTWCIPYAFIEATDAPEWAFTVLEGTTNLIATSMDPCSINTDVYFWEMHDDDWNGLWECVNDVNDEGERCSTGDVVLDTEDLSALALPELNMRKTAVHEVGHSLGVGHTGLGAMVQGPVTIDDDEFVFFHQHDIDAIDAHYP